MSISQDELSTVKSKVELCVKHIDSWMILNGLKFHQDKTELLLISSRFRQSPVLNFFEVGDKKIGAVRSTRNLGVFFDQHLTMDEQVKKVCQASYYHLRNISRI